MIQDITAMDRTDLKTAVKQSGRVLGLFLIGFKLLGELTSGQAAQAARALIGAYGLDDDPVLIILVMTSIMQLIGLVLFGLFYVFNRQRIRGQIIPRQTMPASQLRLAIGLMFGFNFAITFLNYLFWRASGRTLGLPMDFSRIGHPLMLFVMLAVIPSLIEEVMFRFIIYRYLRRHGILFGAVVSSLLFGLFHLNILQFVFASLLGLVLVFVYERTGKLRYPILIHLLNNSLSVLMIALPLSEPVRLSLQIGLGIISLVFFSAVVIHHRRLIGPILKFTGRQIAPAGYFFRAVPMFLFALFSLGFSIALIFII